MSEENIQSCIGGRGYGKTLQMKSMLDINIYGKYEVFFHTKGSTQVGFDEFERYEYNDSRTFSGVDLITMLSRAMTSQGLMSMVIKDNKIYMEFFNPNTGEGHDTVYTINEVGGM